MCDLAFILIEKRKQTPFLFLRACVCGAMFVNLNEELIEIDNQNLSCRVDEHLSYSFSLLLLLFFLHRYLAVLCDDILNIDDHEKKKNVFFFFFTYT